jgi:hypothetical protein
VATPPRAERPPGTAGAGLLPAGGDGVRWYLDGTRIAQLAVDNAIGARTAYRYLHEGIDALASAASDVHQALTGQTGLSRSTVQARLARLEADGVLDSFER